MSENELITNKEIERVWGNADFGEELNKNKRSVIDNALLKTACGYSNGYNASCILEDLALINNKMKLTKHGREYLYSVFVKDRNF